MQFDIRSISLVESIRAEARINVGELAGKNIEFRAGIRFMVTLPSELTHFILVSDSERILTALPNWARVFRYPEGRDEIIHVLAPADDGVGGIVYYRVDLRQLPPETRRGLRPAVTVTGGAVMNYDECASWLIELDFKWLVDRDPAQRRLIIVRPCPSDPATIRLACVCPALLGTQLMSNRLQAIGDVLGAKILPVIPRRFKDVEAQLAGAMPLDSVLVCRAYAPHITTDAIPNSIPADLVHFCDSSTAEGIERQTRTWVELAQQQIAANQEVPGSDSQDMLLAVMLRGMMSHAKIGQFKHCPLEDVTRGVRARRLSVAGAETILQQNGELFQDTKESQTLFLWKEHNDGRQYFLNPKRVEEIRILIAAALG